METTHELEERDRADTLNLMCLQIEEIETALKDLQKASILAALMPRTWFSATLQIGAAADVLWATRQLMLQERNEALASATVPF